MQEQWALVRQVPPPKDTWLLLACNTWPHSRLMGRPVPVKIGELRSDGSGWHIQGASWHPTHWRSVPAPPPVHQP